MTSMTRIRIGFGTLLLAAALILPASSAAQTAGTVRPARFSVAVAPLDVDMQFDFDDRWGRPVLRVGQDYTLKAGDAIREAAVIYGTATIEGRVERDVVVVFGTVRLAESAVIGGSLVLVGGTAVVAPGAIVHEDLVVVGGAFDAPPEFSPGGHHIVIGPAALGGRLEAIVPWITRGLLWGRPIVPDLQWVWVVAGTFFLVYLMLSLVFHKPVAASAETLAAKPLTAFVVGLLVLLLMGPVCLLLAVSVIGLAVVPFVICAIFVAALIGRIGVARWIGMSAVPQESPESRVQSLRSFIIGSAVITIAYMVPVLGFVTWTMVGVFGLGAATLAFFAAYRKENPAAVRVPKPIPPVPPAPAPAYRYEAAPPAEIEAEPEMAVDQSPVATKAPARVSELASFPHAAFLDRAAAFALDVILVVIAQQLLDLSRRDSAVFLLLLAYHIGFWTWKGTTVGGIICQLRVVRIDGAPLRFVDALVRGLSSIFSLAVLGLGCLWILKDPERQAWHDKIAGTYVIKVPRHWPI
jgi:uncharacterized RDD family membrane protein YckC